MLLWDRVVGNISFFHLITMNVQNLFTVMIQDSIPRGTVEKNRVWNILITDKIAKVFICPKDIESFVKIVLSDCRSVLPCW